MKKIIPFFLALSIGLSSFSASAHAVECDDAVVVVDVRHLQFRGEARKEIKDVLAGWIENFDSITGSKESYFLGVRTGMLLAGRMQRERCQSNGVDGALALLREQLKGSSGTLGPKIHVQAVSEAAMAKALVCTNDYYPGYYVEIQTPNLLGPRTFKDHPCLGDLNYLGSWTTRDKGLMGFTAQLGPNSSDWCVDFSSREKERERLETSCPYVQRVTWDRPIKVSPWAVDAYLKKR